MPRPRKGTKQYNELLTRSRQKGVGWGDPSSTSTSLEMVSYQHESHLALKTLAIMLVSAFVAIVVHYWHVLNLQTESIYNTLMGLAEGPVVIVCVAGLLGLGLIFVHYGGESALYNAIYAPFVMIAAFFILWAETRSGMDSNPYTWKSVEFTPETIVWGFIIVAMLVNTVMVYMDGHMRLDALHTTSSGSMAFITMAILLSLGLSRIMELIVQTLRFTELDEGSGGYIGGYIVSILMVVVVIVIAMKALDFGITLVAGHITTQFIPRRGQGASIAFKHTARAYRIAIFTIVVVTAALVWRRHRKMGKEGEGDSKRTIEDIRGEWKTSLSALLLIPFIAIVVEFVKEIQRWNKPLYFILRSLVLSIAIIMIGTGIIPWNNTTIMISVFLISFVAFQFMGNSTLRTPLAAALVLSMAFTIVRIMYKQQTKDMTSREQKRWAWTFMVAPVIMFAEFFTHSNAQYYGKPGDHDQIVYVFTRLVLLYSIFIFIDGDFDSIEGDVIEGNEPASYAADTLVMMCIVFVYGTVSGVTISNYDAAGGDYIEGYEKAQKTHAQLLSTWMFGALGAYTFHMVRQNQSIIDYFARSQIGAEDVYNKFYSDVFHRIIE